MGVVGSKIAYYGKRLVMRYNVEERAYKFLNREKLPPAPRHELKKQPKEVSLSRDALEDIHCKNIQLNEYLKKVYLTSTSEVTGTPSKRPKPKKENERKIAAMFHEPETPAPGCCTLSNIVEILLKFEPQSKKWNIDAIADKFNIDRKDVVLLVTYYSLYRKESFQFMTQKESKPQKIEFEVFNQLEKKPIRKIDSK